MSIITVFPAAAQAAFIAPTEEAVGSFRPTYKDLPVEQAAAEIVSGTRRPISPVQTRLQIPLEPFARSICMKRTSIQTLVAAVAWAAFSGLFSSAVVAQDVYPDTYYPGHPKLFRNYYVGGAGQGAPAQLYVSPRPVPAYVGHTWITYEPLMPHEFLYAHHRTYWAHNADCSWTKTKVKWSPSFGLPFVRTLHDCTNCPQSPFDPWQNPWALLR
jgi:hypothetical protein